jgi:hypothetical protein
MELLRDDTTPSSLGILRLTCRCARWFPVGCKSVLEISDASRIVEAIFLWEANSTRKSGKS